jgi:hypothetical protein
MTDAEKEKLCVEMQAVGLVERDANLRWACTLKGNVWHAALFAILAWEDAKSVPVTPRKLS